VASLAHPQPEARTGGNAPRGHAIDAVVLAVLAVLLVAGVAAWQSLGLTFSKCWFLGATGLPCPTCGSTRALLGLGHMEFASAFATNPLLVLTAFLLPIHAGLTLLERHLGVFFLDPIRRAATVRRVSILVAALALANWIYLLVALPR